MNQNAQQVSMKAVAHTKSRVHLNKVTVPLPNTPKGITDDLMPKIASEDCDPYALDLIIPTNMPGVQKTRSFSSAGRDLDARGIAIKTQDDGVSVALAATEDGGKNWRCVGIIVNNQIAQAIADAWKEGLIQFDFNHGKAG